MIFPKGVRFIAINDGGQRTGTNDFALRNITLTRMAGERYEQENTGSKTDKRYDWQAHHKPVYGYLMDKGRKFHH